MNVIEAEKSNLLSLNISIGMYNTEWVVCVYCMYNMLYVYTNVHNMHFNLLTL